MGSFMSGNPNCRKHDGTASRIRVDSYTFTNHVHNLRETGREITAASIKWENGSSVIAGIFADKIRLKYKFVNTGETVTADYSLSFTPNRYGGRDRIYFVCSNCGRRVRYLYIDKKHFKCRRCASLTYPSQRVTKGNDQCIFRMRKAAAKLIPEAWEMAPMDLGYARPAKPKGMRWGTYYNYLMAFYKTQEDYHENFISTVKRRFGIVIDE